MDRGPFFSDKAFLENYRRLLGNTTNAPIQTILRKSLSNAVRLLAFFAYYYSLGGVRFNNLQRYSIIYAVYYEKYPSAIQNAYIILQLAALILPANDVVWEMTRVFLYSLSQEPDGKKMPAVGQNLMHSYLLIDLLAACYQRTYFTRDMDVGLKDLMMMMMTMME